MFLTGNARDPSCDFKEASLVKAIVEVESNLVVRTAEEARLMSPSEYSKGVVRERGQGKMSAALG
jgi:hypothetical protein